MAARANMIWSTIREPAEVRREHPEHLKHSPSGRGGSVEALLVQEQINALIMQSLQNAEQIGE